MAEIVTSSGNIAENLESGLVGATDWTNLSNGLSQNGLDTYCNFASGNYSNYLYIRDFGFDLPADAKIDGITVTVKRRGEGITNDHYVGLIFGTGLDDYEITAPGKQIETVWDSSYSNIVYGNSTDIWNRNWTPDEINSEYFGFAIAIEGDSSNLDSGSIDYISLSISYHHVYSEIADSFDTAPLSGSATVNFIDFIVPESASLKASGHGALQFTEPVGGVARIGGDDAISNHSYHTFGGTTAGGSASVSFVYKLGTSGGARLAGDTIIRYRANHTVSGGARLSGSAPAEHYYGVTGGSFAAGVAEQQFTYNPALSGSLLISGSAFVDPYLATGGAFASGSHTSIVTRSVVVSGGIRGAGSAFNQVQKAVSGGLLCSGQSVGGRTIEIPQWDLPLSASQMVPATTSTAVAQLEAWFNPATLQFSYRVTQSGASSTVTGISFHGKPVGETGLPFLTVSSAANVISGSAVILNTTASALLRGSVYVQLNTEDNPSGELRGQILHFGAKASGQALVKPYIEIVTGGSLISGSALVKPYWDAVQGGAKCAGRAVVNSVYKDGGLGATEYSFICNGNNVVPTNPSETRTALAKVRVDAADNKLYWDIRYNFGPIGWNAVRFRAQAEKNAIAARAIVLVEDLQRVDFSPIIGSTTITAGQVNSIVSGKCYLQLRRDTPYLELRGQLTNDSGRLNGSAVQTAIFSSDTASGGAKLAGSALVVNKVNIPAFTNQIAVGGPGAIVSLTNSTSGGVACVGSATVTVTNIIIGDGGCKASGSGLILFNYRITPSGGTQCASAGLIAIQPSISGGAICAGISVQQWIAKPVITGGAVVTPLHVKQQIYAAQAIQGGAVCSGRVIGEKIKYFVSIRRGYGYAMASSNILNTAPDNVVRLIDPVGEISPELNVNRFRNEDDTTWCDVEERCSGGVLPKVIQRRQKGILPPRLRGSVRRDRRLATAA